MCGEGCHSVEGEDDTTERRLLRWRDILENAGGQHPIDGLCSRDPVLMSRLSTELLSRVQIGRAFSTQVYFCHRASQWCRKKGTNALGARDSRIVIDDWTFLPKGERREPTVASIAAFNSGIPWSTVDDTSIRLETFMTPDLEVGCPPSDRTLQ